MLAHSLVGAHSAVATTPVRASATRQAMEASGLQRPQVLEASWPTSSVDHAVRRVLTRVPQAVLMCVSARAMLARAVHARASLVDDATARVCNSKSSVACSIAMLSTTLHSHVACAAAACWCVGISVRTSAILRVHARMQHCAARMWWPSVRVAASSRCIRSVNWFLSCILMCQPQEFVCNGMPREEQLRVVVCDAECEAVKVCPTALHAISLVSVWHITD